MSGGGTGGSGRPGTPRGRAGAAAPMKAGRPEAAAGSDAKAPTAECRRCRFHYVTWDGRHPKGCRYYGFKSAQEPSHAVYESSGEPCKAFAPKGPRN